MAPPEHPLLLARLGLRAWPPASVLLRAFSGTRARALLAGMAAHVMAPLTAEGTGAVALVFALAGHAVGWPVPRGGSGSITRALAGHLAELGGTVHTGVRVGSMSQLPTARAYLFDTSPTALAAIAGSRLGTSYRCRLARYRYGPGVFKIDYALDGAVPWTEDACRRATTVHVGGDHREIGAALAAASRGRVPERPFLLTAQPGIVDGSRAPEGKQAFWVYAHVPHGFTGDLTGAVERQLERYAPGFRDRVLARCVRRPADLAANNPNYVGGDIACGAFTGLQTLFRPIVSAVPYATPDRAIYLCSSATPPGPGVHGMCGYHAARVALRRSFGYRGPH